MIRPYRPGPITSNLDIWYTASSIIISLVTIMTYDKFSFQPVHINPRFSFFTFLILKPRCWDVHNVIQWLHVLLLYRHCCYYKSRKVLVSLLTRRNSIQIDLPIALLA